MPLPSQDQRLSVAVHYRWGDLAKSENDRRRLSLEQIRTVLDLLGAHFNLSITLYAELLDPDTRPALGHEYRLQNGGWIVDLVNEIASADVILASTSGFTVLPAILAGVKRSGVVITHEAGQKYLTPFTANIALLSNASDILRCADFALKSRLAIA
ncbi:hypothetical protein OIV83_004262 [Microbotryomycetes sp. JL201]|nr:hypothetical protein OIV83_004262 [Microbotryomycetes sp. JL201]